MHAPIIAAILLALPYILSLASLIFAIKKNLNWAGGLLVPAAGLSYLILTGGVTAVSLAPAIICGITVIVLLTTKPSRDPKKKPNLEGPDSRCGESEPSKLSFIYLDVCKRRHHLFADCSSILDLFGRLRSCDCDREVIEQCGALFFDVACGNFNVVRVLGSSMPPIKKPNKSTTAQRASRVADC